MCLAVPGKVVFIDDDSNGPGRARMATVDFQGSRVKASLVLTPEARAGDWVLVHAGFAIQLLDEQDALETWKYLNLMDAEESEGDAPGENRSSDEPAEERND